MPKHKTPTAEAVVAAIAKAKAQQTLTRITTNKQFNIFQNFSSEGTNDLIPAN